MAAGAFCFVAVVLVRWIGVQGGGGALRVPAAAAETS